VTHPEAAAPRRHTPSAVRVHGVIPTSHGDDVGSPSNARPRCALGSCASRRALPSCPTSRRVQASPRSTTSRCRPSKERPWPSCCATAACARSPSLGPRWRSGSRRQFDTLLTWVSSGCPPGRRPQFAGNALFTTKEAFLELVARPRSVRALIRCSGTCGGSSSSKAAFRQGQLLAEFRHRRASGVGSRDANGRLRVVRSESGKPAVGRVEMWRGGCREVPRSSPA